MGKKSSAATPAPFRKTLTSAERNLHVAAWTLSGRAGKGRSAPAWSVRKFTLHGGRQEGVDLIEVDNGRLRFTVIPTRGMGVLKVELGDVRLGWDSPVRGVVHPQFINLPSRGGLGWLEGFNEWLVRCGLEFAGAPGRDQFVTNTGATAEMDLTLHGKIANIPASEVEVVIDRAPPFRIRVRGRVDERMLFGPKLELWTEISTEPGAGTFRVEDVVTNRGATEQEFQLIYHVNYGSPLLEAGARFAGAFEAVMPINEHAAKSVKNFATYAGPQAGFVEEVYCLRPLADGRGQTKILLHNAAADRGASMAFDVHQLPCLTLWKNTGAVADGYVTGIEPATGFPNNRRAERQAGRVPKLLPGEARKFAIDYAVHTDAGAVSKVRDEIQRLQGERQPQIDTRPANAG